MKIDMADYAESWKPMIDAPRDGRRIIALFFDHSGVEAIRWGSSEKDDLDTGWFKTDYSDIAGNDDDFLGWTPYPTYLIQHSPDVDKSK